MEGRMNLSRPAVPVGEEMHRVTYVFIKKAGTMQVRLKLLSLVELIKNPYLLGLLVK